MQLLTLKPFRLIPKWFFDDNEDNLKAIENMGGISINAREWNENCGIKSI